jgi:hypothetical protein
VRVHVSLPLFCLVSKARQGKARHVMTLDVQAFFTWRVPRRGSNQQCDDDAPVQGNNGSLSKDPAEGRELTRTS